MRTALVLAALAAATSLSAVAQQVVLYESPGFRGRNVTINQQAPNLGDHGFAKRVSSVQVMSGTWEFCTQAYFRGQCRTFGPGEYATLGGPENRISSARLADASGQGIAASGGRPEGAADAEISLYDRRNFQGPLRTLNGAAPDFGRLGINDAVASLEVRRGTWELCTDANYRGDCRIYGPGRYASVPDGQDDAYSSARPVRGAASGARWEDAGDAEVSVYDRRNFEGPLRSLRTATPNFGPLGFNDAIASMVVRRGTWEFCTDADFRGECRTYGPGQYPSLPAGQDDRYSSARPVEAGRDRPAGGRTGEGPAQIRLFEFGQFGGRSIWLRSSTPDLERIGFNDRAESVIVEGGTWTLCSDANQQGECRVFRPGQYPALPPELNARISSAYTR